MQSLSATQWVKFGGRPTGYDAPIQFHPQGKSPSQMAAAASHKSVVARWAWLDRLHGTLSALWLAENLLFSE